MESKVKEMTGMHAALIRAHRAALHRYCGLLATDLTQLEREYIHRRIAETRLQLERLELGKIEPSQRSDAEAAAFSGAWGNESAPCLPV
ncbi:MAG TPA: hypothetical protein VJT13_14410 [Xanthobacteraceae bacterium]|nr:hypothetical protein [Xanthobacteraceae bacterium]